LIKA
jgi:hypothetical protein